MHFVDEENIVTYVDFRCDITSYPETPTKVRQINREQKYISGFCEKLKCVPSNNQQQYNSKIFVNPYNLWDIVRTALMSLNHTNDRYSMSNRTLKHQITNLEQTHIRCSLQCERWTVKGRDWESALHFFNEITYQMDEWTKQLLRLESWVISGNPEQWMEFRLLRWTVVVIKCSYLLQFFDLYCLLERNLLFFKSFCRSFLWWLWLRSKTSSTTSV